MTKKCTMLFPAVLALTLTAVAQQWFAAPTYPGQGAGTAILRSDGTIMVEEMTGQASQGGFATGVWYLLAPGEDNSYVDGTWFGINGLPAGYAPLYFASAVLPNASVIVEGGEYNFSSNDDTTLGAIFNWDHGTWSSVSPPSGWTAIGDAPSVVLSDGSFMLGEGGNCCLNTAQAILDLSTMTWTPTGFGKTDANSEEGWTLLPNGRVLTVDTQISNSAEGYNPATGKWTRTKKIPVNLAWDCGNPKIVPEVGPAVLMPNGLVFATGANGFTAIYNYKNDSWSAGPNFPPNSAGQGPDGIADGPAALLVNGHVLTMASNVEPCNIPPADFYEFDGTQFITVPGPPNAGNEVSYDGRMVDLPNGDVLFTDGTRDVEIYRPTGSPQSSWAPVIKSAPSTITLTKDFTVKGTQFNGLSQGAAYGDDAQMATNFPLVRVKNKATGHYFYAVSFSFSSMGVATGSKTVSATAHLDNAETGPSYLEVVANGISSVAVDVTVEQ